MFKGAFGSMALLQLPRITISAPHRSSGKSTVTIGLCAALSSRGLKVQPFKKGPDFIDPMWHEAASGRASHNLDIYMMGGDVALDSFKRNAAGADISVIEGNMGLFDGMDIEGSDSTAGLARLLKAPVILVIDCYGMTRGIAPLVRGFESFEPVTNVAGVILNKVRGARHEKKLREAIERYCNAKVVGALPQEEGMAIAMRHLGLVPIKEEMGLSPAVSEMERIIRENTDVDSIIDIANSAPPLECAGARAVEFPVPDIKIGVAMDRAFTFYYPENLDALRLAGAELVSFSPISDKELPDVDALYIGGGFPEVHMKDLEANEGMRRAIRGAAEDGMPVYAECGGLMYLCESITWQGKTSKMAGVFPHHVKMSERPSGHGYMILKPTGASPWPPFGESIKAHEFHHSHLELSGASEFALEVVRGKGIEGGRDGLIYKNVLAGYAHLHSLAAPGWARSIVAFIRKVLK